jgi:hypothetical protein
MVRDYEDVARLRLLLQQADRSLNKAAKNLNKSQLDGAKERAQYFEKLAIGSGAAIAAIVSFLGTRAEKLQPVWILRCSLVALVVAMVAALYRNLRYPNYLLAVRNRLWIEASRYQQQCKNDVFQADRSVVSWQSGTPIDLVEWTAGFRKSDAGLEILVQDRTRRENRLLSEFKAAEYVCLSSICVAMLSLVWLALRNF